MLSRKQNQKQKAQKNGDKDNKQKGPTQRSMTFSGCFTCRARGVKCDEQRPSCVRCVKAGRECAGYGVRLVWADQEGQRNSEKNQKSQSQNQTPKANASALRSQRRSLPWAYGTASGAPAEIPALGDDVLDAVLAAMPSGLDTDAEYGVDIAGAAKAAAAKTHEHPHATLFGVFAAAPDPLPPASSSSSSSSSPPPSSSSPESQQLALALPRRTRDNCIPSPVLQACLDDLDNGLDPTVFGSIASLDAADFVDAMFDMARQPFDATMPYTTTAAAAASAAHNYHWQPVARLCPSPQPPKESQLLDYWATHTSNIMIAIPRNDNPYRTIYIPMALAAQSQLVPSDEQTALLHSIFAMAAFNHAQRQPLSSRGAYNKVGMDHHQLSMVHLQRCLAAGHTHDPEVVLATINLLVATNCVTCSSTSWRTLLRLGRQWLNSAAQTQWHTSPTASTLYQIFLMMEALGTSTGMTGLSDVPYEEEGSVQAAPNDGSAETVSVLGPVAPSSRGVPDYTYSSIFGLSCPAVSYYYRLDGLFGIAQPIFEAIVHMNRLSAQPGPPSQQEVDNLRAKIMLNDPRALRSDALALAGETERRFIMHHAYVYYFACRIHYERMLFHVAPHTVQHLVRSALDHLDAIAQLGTNVDVVGLTWPVLVVACEADDSSLQKRVAWYFEQGHKYGVWGISSAYQVLSEVWRQRKLHPRDCHANVSWQNVMRELGLDLLLT